MLPKWPEEDKPNHLIQGTVDFELSRGGGRAGLVSSCARVGPAVAVTHRVYAQDACTLTDLRGHQPRLGGYDVTLEAPGDGDGQITWLDYARHLCIDTLVDTEKQSSLWSMRAANQSKTSFSLFLYGSV